MKTVLPDFSPIDHMFYFFLKDSNYRKSARNIKNKSLNKYDDTKNDFNEEQKFYEQN